MNLLLKFSGEFFDSKDDLSELGKDFLKEIAHIDRAYIVIGGGNRMRGRDSSYTRSQADHIGVISTLMNGFILKEHLEQAGKKVKLFSHFAQFGEFYDAQKAIEAFNSGHWVIFASGLGKVSHISTDMSAVIKALEVNADAVVKLTRDYGVYDKDPKFADAKLIPEIDYEDVLRLKLPVMDYGAIAIAQEHKMPIAVMNIKDFPKFMRNEKVGSIIGKMSK